MSLARTLSLGSAETVTATDLGRALGMRRRDLNRALRGCPFVTQDADSRWPERVYPLAELPTEVRVKLDRETLSDDEFTLLGLGSSLATRFEHAPKEHREVARKRMRAVELFLQLQSAGLTGLEATAEVSKQLSAGRRSVLKWRRLVRNSPRREDWPALLLPEWHGRPGVAPMPIHPAAWDWLVSDMLRKSRPGFAECYERLLAESVSHPEWGAIPSESSLRRRYRREVPRAVQVLRREGQRALMDRLPSPRTDKRALGALREINGDGHTFDVLVSIPAATPGAKPRKIRPTLLAWQDTYSGALVGWTVSETENWDATRIALHKVLSAWGAPDKALIDNGHAFASKAMTSGAGGRRHRFKDKPSDPDGIFKALGIKVRFAKPGKPQHKQIEAAFGSALEERIAKHPLCEGAYTGNSPETKPDNYDSRAVPWDKFVALVEQEIQRFNDAPARTLVCDGRSRMATFKASLAERVMPPRRFTKEQLQWLLMVSENRRVSTDEAVVTLLGNRFGGVELIEHQGETVTLRYNPEDITEGVWVFKPGTLAPVCHAPLIELVGYSNKEEQRRAARIKHIQRKAVKDQAKVMGGLSPRELAAGITPSRERIVSNVIAPDFQIQVPKTTMSPERLKRIEEIRERMARGETDIARRMNAG